MEIKLIDKYDTRDPRKGYNINIGGECGALGLHRSADTRKKISEANKRRHLSSETRLKISESHKGILPSAEARRKMSESHKGKNTKAVICVETGTVYSSVGEAAKSIGVTRNAIGYVLRGVTKTSGGYHWRYAVDRR